MSQTSQILCLRYIQSTHGQKHVTHNEALRQLGNIVPLAVSDVPLLVRPSAPLRADDIASLLFQKGFSSRAEIGAAGSDNFLAKVSTDAVEHRYVGGDAPLKEPGQEWSRSINFCPSRLSLE